MTAWATGGTPPASVPRYAVPLLVAACAGTIIALTALLLLEGPRPITTALQVVLIASFMGLALLDLRAAVAIAMIELAVAGASGQWTRLPGGISGRVALDMTVAFAGAFWLVRDWRRHGRLDLGRYGPHALAIALLLPLIWMPLGLLNGNHPADVIADGNGHLFLAFSLACIALIRQGHGAWLRHWLLVACAANALVTFALIAVSVPGIVPLPTLAQILHSDLLAGNVIGYQPNGAYRLFLASGLYLQLGLALVTWRLLQRPASILSWGLYAILWIDVAATYTRGFWIGAVAAITIVLIVGAATWRRAATVVVGSVAIFVLATAIGAPFGFSVPNYVGQRLGSLTATDLPTQPTGSGGGGSSGGGQNDDVSGAVSNQIRVHQAEVLIGHISERPIIGWGFGTIAQDYRYDKIFSYELAFLDLLYKTGIVGLLVFISFPVRLIVDALRARVKRLALPVGVSPREMAVVVSIVASIGLTGATNPYFLAAFGLMPIIVMIAWLDPIRPVSAERPSRGL
jgi:hypothetical protein